MATYYVATTGSNGNLGSILSPWQTVNFGVNQLVAGDTLYLRGGTYNENVSMTPSGTSGARILISSFESEPVLISGTTTTFNDATFILNGCDFVTLYDFDVTQSPASTAGHGVMLNAASDDNIFDALHIYTVKHSGIYSWISSNGTIRYCTIEDCFEGDGNNSDGIGLANNFVRETRNWTIENNTIFNVGDDGIDAFWHAGNIIRNNLIYTIGRGTNGNGNGIKIGPGGSNTIYNNRIYDLRSGGIAGNEGPDNLIYNNTVYNAASYWYGVWGGTFGSGLGCILRNNIGSGTPGGNTFSVAVTESHNTWNLGLTASYQSLDPTNTDFLKLVDGNSCIDAGTDLSSVFTTDAFGTVRPQSSGWDLGVHEFVAPSSPSSFPGTKTIIWF